MSQKKQTGILTFESFTQKKSGSTFLRAIGLSDTTDDFHIWKHGVAFDNLIFQKVYWQEMMECFEGPKILDLCDPDWVTGSVDIIEIGRLVDAITCSSPALTELVRSYFPKKIVEHVPDRLDFSMFPPPKRHFGKARTVVWFGFVHNAYETLFNLAPTIRKNNLQLVIISDRPYKKDDEVLALNPGFIPYNQQTAYRNIQKADIVLNPQSSKAFFKYKSNNKTIIAWKLGLPVATSSEELEMLINPECRNREIDSKKELVENDYNISKSAVQYRDIVARVRRTRFY